MRRRRSRGHRPRDHRGPAHQHRPHNQRVRHHHSTAMARLGWPRHCSALLWRSSEVAHVKYLRANAIGHPRLKWSYVVYSD
jgi:hypothetical protein